MQNLIFTFNVVTPVFLIISIGFFLKRKGVITNNFVRTSSKIVFTVTLPALVFIKLSTTDFNPTFNFRVIIFIYICIFFFFALSWLISIPLSKDGKDRASFIHGCFRSNFAIVGFALITNMFGNHALSKAAIILAFVMPLYNILGIIALTVPVKEEKQIDLKKTIIEIISNPLILATVVAILFSYLKIMLPKFLIKTIDYLALLTLPLALLGIGGSLKFESIKKKSKLTLIATLMKIVIIPASAIFVAFHLGFTEEDIGIFFMLFATPTAIVSYIMAEAMDCNSELAGNIIVMTTLGSIFTLALGIFFMKSIGLL